MSHVISSHRAVPSGQVVAGVARAVEATRLQFLWMCALMLSFCYELPLMQLTSMDRANPRLFDVVAMFGVIILLFHNHNFQRPVHNPILKSWSRLVVWFGLCAGIWAMLWFPWGVAGKFSVYYALKYAEGLFCLYLAAVIPISSRQKHILHWMVVFGGLVVAGYAVLEKLQGSSVRFVTEGTEIRRAEGTLFSCLGPVYFHVATFSVTVSAMTFALANKYPLSLKKLFLFSAAGFVAWPAVFCGSRTGLAMLFLVVGGVFMFMKRTRVTLLFAIGFSCVAVLSLMNGEEFIENATESSASIRRLIGFESGRDVGNSISARMNLGTYGLTIFGGESYKWQGYRLPLFGGGFYAVPHSAGGQIANYRIGYGIHNGYLFPYEQAGILGALLAAIFLFTTIKYIRKALRFPNETDRQFAVGAWCLVIAYVPAIWVGQIFWHGFGTENMNTFLVLILVLAVKPSCDAVRLHRNPNFIRQARPS